MQTCTKCYSLSPDSATHCVQCQADLSEYSQTVVTLKKFQNNPRVINLRLVAHPDCCPACRDFEGFYEKQEAPKLPIEGCSHDRGCRCFYEPMLDEIFP